MECSFRSKNSVMKNKKERKYCRAETQKKKKKNLQRRKNRDEIEEKRWSEGWIMLMADGYGEESGLEREKEEGKKKKRKKRDGLKDETGHRKWGPPCQYIYGNAIENRVMETENS